MNPKVILITGASSGIGAAAALELVRRGQHVTGTARSLDKLQTLAAQCEPLAGKFHPIQADVREAAEVQAAVDETVRVFGGLDVLVANAGVGHRGSLIDAEWEDLETLMRTNMDGVLHSIRAAVPAMRQRGGGHLVLISSITFNMTVPYAAIYAASKAFVSSIARSLRIELEDDAVYVTDMFVGRTDTQFNENRLGHGAQTNRGTLPTMTPERVANAIADVILVRRRKTVALRLFDRLVMLANTLFPELVGRRAKRQYR